jgi:hypothetical protein
MIFWKIFTRGRGFVAFEWVCAIGARFNEGVELKWRGMPQPEPRKLTDVERCMYAAMQQTSAKFPTPYQATEALNALRALARRRMGDKLQYGSWWPFS